MCSVYWLYCKPKVRYGDLILCSTCRRGSRGSVVVKQIGYKLEGRGFETR
jgi:hypothetical protein